MSDFRTVGSETRGLQRWTEQEMDDFAWAVQRYTETVTAAGYKPLSEARRMDRLTALLDRLRMEHADV